MPDKITLDNGKYTVVNELNEGGGFYALRYGEDWRSLVGDGLVLEMFSEIKRLNKAVELCREFHESYERGIADKHNALMAVEEVLRIVDGKEID